MTHSQQILLQLVELHLKHGRLMLVATRCTRTLISLLERTDAAQGVLRRVRCLSKARTRSAQFVDQILNFAS